VAVSFIGGGNRRTRRKLPSHWQTISHNVVHLALIKLWTYNISGNRYWLHIGSQNRLTNPNMNSIPIISNVVSLAPQGKYYYDKMLNYNIIHVVLILILYHCIWYFGHFGVQLTIMKWGRRGRDRMVVGFTTTYMQSVPITTDVVSSKLDQGEVYNIMWYSLSVTW
jgi:hypothetical protein